MGDVPVVTRSMTERAEKSLEAFNLSDEDRALLVEFMSADPDRRLPAEGSREKQTMALSNLVELLKVLKKKRLSTIIDDLSSEFLEMLYKAILDFPSVERLIALEEVITLKKQYTLRRENDLLKINEVNRQTADGEESKFCDANSKLEYAKDRIILLEKTCQVLKENSEEFKGHYNRSLLEYESFLAVRRSLDYEFEMM